jgi:hypothetical protein
MPADKSALGHLPLAAFQYCEAMRQASSRGWYVFPPEDLSLHYDGYQVYIAEDGDWVPLFSRPFGEDFGEVWNQTAPPEFRNHAPDFLTSLSDIGTVQIWSGFFVATAPGFGIRVRPLVNIHKTATFYCHEAIVETDSFQPCPLFVNIKIVQTGVEIQIRREFPLFQVELVPTDPVGTQDSLDSIADSIAGPQFPWESLRRTLRIDGVSEPRKSAGQYGAAIRKRNRQAG